uniref:Uncharacterized protein n=1 Tax=Chromera velia CCMP2878 TaxID=1169474 RepID=A0A0G4FUU2_9ALVE|eukprot:Cvel_18874.t1-p1 / transcript=Cvel_18874.t1 / gene=Cvel_18874 / organism=Chromera_velia_CCMP2878 / gene_product=hypothetical protein / transcript_product=hypothetical protein / location=Cvel_scaffold1589:13150-13656(+) / protein_length=169 / sequence_SO=supercontig / SO=protein_coding / is_pseudo=false
MYLITNREADGLLSALWQFCREPERREAPCAAVVSVRELCAQFMRAMAAVDASSAPSRQSIVRCRWGVGECDWKEIPLAPMHQSEWASWSDPLRKCLATCLLFAGATKFGSLKKSVQELLPVADCGGPNLASYGFGQTRGSGGAAVSSDVRDKAAKAFMEARGGPSTRT